MGTSDISFQELSIFLWRAEKKNAASKENQMAGFQVCENICSQTSGRNEQSLNLPNIMTYLLKN